MRGGEVARMRKARSADQFRQRRKRVVVKSPNALGFVRHDDPSLAPWVLRRHSGWTMIGVASLRLHATEREHEATRGVAPVGAERQYPSHVEACDDTPGRTEANGVAQPGSHQTVVGEQESIAHRSPDVVDEFQRSCTGAAFGAVDHHEIRTDTGLQHGLADAHELPGVSDAKLEADRLAAGQLAQSCDEVHHLERCGEGGMPGRRHAVHADRHAASSRDLGGYLGRGQDAAMARLGPLRKLDLDHLDLGLRRLRGEAVGAKRAIVVATAEVAASDLPDDVAAELAMITAIAAFAGVVREVAELRTLVERADRIGAERAEAHRGDVEQGQGIGLAAFRSANRHTEVVTGRWHRHERVIDPFEIGTVNVLLRPKWPLVELAFGALIYDCSLRAVEGHAIGVAFQEVLADLRPNLLQPEADVGEDRIIAPQTVLGLHHVPDADQHQDGTDDEWHEKKAVAQSEQPEHERADDARDNGDVSHAIPPGYLIVRQSCDERMSP